MLLAPPPSTHYTHHLKDSAVRHTIIAAFMLQMRKQSLSLRLTTSVTPSTTHPDNCLIPHLMYGQWPLRLSPHIHLTINRSILSKHCISSDFAGLTAIDQHPALYAHMLYKHSLLLLKKILRNGREPANGCPAPRS